MTKIFFLAALSAGSLNAQAQNKTSEIGKTTTLYGNGTPGNANGPSATDVRFNAPIGLAIDKNGTIYIAEDGAKGIRKITAAGQVSLLAGSNSGEKGLNDGNGEEARFTTLLDVAIHPKTGDIYVVDGNRIRKVTTQGEVSTFAGAGSNTPGNADGVPSAARFNYLAGIAFDKDGNFYLADRGNHSIRKYTASTSSFTTLAGGTQGYEDGKGASAKFKAPSQLALDEAGNIYVTDRGNFSIRKITPAGVVTTLAGNGTAVSTDGKGSEAGFNDAFGIAVKAGNIYVSEYNGRKVRQIDAKGNVTTIAGNGAAGLTDGAGNTAKFNQLAGIVVGPDGDLYGVERRATVRKISLK
ncbi:Serine/threonine-protein kinase PknD [compost metagenome]